MRVPKLRLHKASGLGLVVIGGEYLYLGKYGTPQCQAAYKRAIAEFMESGSAPLKPTVSLTVADGIARFLKAMKKEFGGDKLTRAELMQTAYANLLPAMRPLRELYGSSPLEDFGPLQLKAVRTKLLNQHKTGRRKDGKPLKRLSRPVVNRRVRSIVQMFRWLAGDAVIDATQWTSLKAVEPLKLGRVDAPEPEPVTPVADAVVDATILHLPQVVADMIRLQRLTGARPGEICKLKPSMIDRADADVWIVQFSKHKNAWRGKSRTLYLGPKAQAILAKYLDRDAEAACFSPSEAMEQRRLMREAKRKTPPNQGNRRGYSAKSRRKEKAKPTVGDSYTSASFGKAIRYACRLAWPVPKSMKSKAAIAAWHREHSWSPNQLRHSRGTELRKQHGVDAASVILGHSSPDTTLIYAEADIEKAKRIASSES
jgi:integrase